MELPPGFWEVTSKADLLSFSWRKASLDEAYQENNVGGFCSFCFGVLDGKPNEITIISQLRIVRPGAKTLDNVHKDI